MNIKDIVVYMNYWRSIPFYLICLNSKFSEKVKMDISTLKRKHTNLHDKSYIYAFSWLVMNTKEFRNVMFNRLHRNLFSYLFCRILFKPLSSLYINMPPEDIGGGLYFQHGFSTIIAAKKIGENCSINQQVTIGYNGDSAPIIGDNVTIAAGAIVIGGVSIHNNAIVGAGAVVTHDVKENDVVVGYSARSIK